MAPPSESDQRDESGLGQPSLQSASADLRRSTADIQPPPTTWISVLRQIGPGLIITASIVGSGELIVTTKLGAEVGFVLLWFIVLGCMIKVFVQIELGRYAIAHGETTLQAINVIPGPRIPWPTAPGGTLGWLVYLWLLMYVATFFQLAGIIGTIADVFLLGLGTKPPEGALDMAQLARAGAVTLSCTVLLAIGRYRLIERISTLMVAMFTLFTVFAVGALQWTDHAINPGDLIEGFSFHLPDDFTIAFAAFGIIGVGASELIYYPYWCLEKGYARAVGPDDGSPEWGERARGWMRVLTVDAWVSMVIYTGATLAFYILGAAVLHGRGLEVSNDELVPSLSHMYSASFGAAGLWIFLIGAFIVLYSTVFIATASNGRLLADASVLFGLVRPHDQQQRDALVRGASALLPIVYLVLFISVDKPLSLVLVGALAQAAMLPLLCLASLYLHHRRMKPELRASTLWTTLLWISSLTMVTAGGYQLAQEAGKLLTRERTPAAAKAGVDEASIGPNDKATTSGAAATIAPSDTVPPVSE